MSITDQRYNDATIKTADNLATIAEAIVGRQLSRLSLPEIEGVATRVAQMIPAGNIPGLILSGLTRLPERTPPPKAVRRDIDLLFKGVEQTLDKAVYGAFFAGPAAVIWGYQSLLRLSGKAPEDAFPEGTWQFYVDYALREDTARHANETHGFTTGLKQHQLDLSEVDRAAAWVMAAITCLHQYPALLANEWRERVYTHLLAELTRTLPEATRYAGLYRQWEKRRPYGRGPAAGVDEDYPAYRRRQFDEFLAGATSELPAEVLQAWWQRREQAEREELPAYQKQMSILAYLDPGPYGETRTPLSLQEVQIGLIYRGHYYLIPVCVSETTAPPDLAVVRAQVAAVLTHAANLLPGTPLAPLAALRRAAWPDLRRKFGPALSQELDRLRRTPILLNLSASHFGETNAPHLIPLSELRQTERGVGDHALTLIDTGPKMVFDQSHIFFDGTWGVALAEIMTQEALYWATRCLSQNQSSGGPHAARPEGGPDSHSRLSVFSIDSKVSEVLTSTTAPASPQRLTFNFQPADLEFIRQSPRVTPEVGAETALVDLPAIQKLRQGFKQRNDQLQLTVNDLLILYRAMHAVTYQPKPQLVQDLEGLTQNRLARPAALAALEAIDPARQVNPAIVMPIDASLRVPRDRLYPVTFEVPPDLDFIQLHQQVLAALAAYHTAGANRAQAFEEFKARQQTYLGMLAGFGQLLARTKEIGGAGDSFSIGVMKLLAHIPTPLQRMLEKVPENFEILNDLIRGREGFSNVGAVAPGSTLTRFMSAKDDNDKKTLVWGVLTDARGVMRISLRDFRPHVGQLIACGHKDIAVRLTQDYLNAYAQGLNRFVLELRRITQSSRETYLAGNRKELAGMGRN